MGIVSINTQGWTSAFTLAQHLSPMSTIGMYAGGHMQGANKAATTLHNRWFPPPASPSAEAVVYSCSDGPSAGIRRHTAKSPGNGRGSSAGITGSSIDEILKGFTTEEANAIIAQLGNINPSVLAVLKLDSEMRNRYVPFLWLAKLYTSNRRGATSRVAQALETVAAELRNRFDLVLRDLREGNLPVRVTASLAISQLHPVVFTVDRGIIDNVAQTLAATAKDKDIIVCHEATIALASIAKLFWARSGMISRGITTLIETMERLRHNAHFDDTHIVTCMDRLDKLIDEHGSLMPSLTPTCVEITKSRALLEKLQHHGATSRVRTTARNLIKKIDLLVEGVRQGL